MRRRTLRATCLWGLLLLCGCSDGDRARSNADGNPRRGAAAGAIVDEESPPELGRAVERMMPGLERLSGLDRRETVRVRRQSRAEARAYVERRLEEEMPRAERDVVRRTYVALGLLPDTLDLDRLLLDLYTEQVLGYYDPKSRTLYVVAGEEVTGLQPVLAHELVHALQDQHTNLDSLVARERGNDRQTAAHAALEGHAMMVMFALLAEEASGRTVDPAALPSPAAELGASIQQNETMPVFRRAPLIVRETLLFPYVRGVDFVHQLWRARRPRARYPAPIDSLLPQSTEHILRPAERFLGRPDPPRVLSFGAAPAPWRALREADFGQLETALFLAHHLGDGARAAANGWGGDRYLLLADADARDVLYWVSVWDSAEEADSFANAARRAAAARPTRSVTVLREEIAGLSAVRIVDAPGGTANLNLHIPVTVQPTPSP